MVDVDDIVARACAGDARSVGRLISWVEDGSVHLPAAMRALTARAAQRTGQAQVIGITGPPGVGKSTMTSALVGSWREQELTVGVLAVDPSSPFSGGALLGDRVRMAEHVTDPGVFIRSMASRGHLGGLAATTPQAVRILEAAGCDVVVIETVGVGQSEVEVAATADTTLVLLAPGMGDGIQAAKAGIMEIGDVIAVNKADRDGADTAAREVAHMLALTDRAEGEWHPIVTTAIASTGDVTEVVVALAAHRAWLTESGRLGERRYARAEAEISALALASVRRYLDEQLPWERRQLAVSVADGRLDPFAAAAQLLQMVDPDGPQAGGAPVMPG